MTQSFIISQHHCGTDITFLGLLLVTMIEFTWSQSCRLHHFPVEFCGCWSPSEAQDPVVLPPASQVVTSNTQVSGKWLTDWRHWPRRDGAVTSNWKGLHGSCKDQTENMGQHLQLSREKRYIYFQGNYNFSPTLFLTGSNSSPRLKGHFLLRYSCLI